jgi:hypothetical protein
MRHNPAAGAVVIMLRTLKMHGMAQACISAWKSDPVFGVIGVQN